MWKSLLPVCQCPLLPMLEQILEEMPLLLRLRMRLLLPQECMEAAFDMAAQQAREDGLAGQ